MKIDQYSLIVQNKQISQICQKLIFNCYQMGNILDDIITFMGSKMSFGYWPVRGSGQVCRLVLAYCDGTDWEDIKYTDSQKWFENDKKNLGFLFPNLPYLIDGDLKLTESKAINFYVIKKSGKTELLGKNIQDQALVQCIISVLVDVRTPLFQLLNDKDWESKVKGVVQKIGNKFQQLSKFYGNKDFALGYLTLVDFYLVELSYYIEKIAPQSFSRYAFFKRTRQCFQKLPQIRKYYEQESSLKRPFVPPMAAIQI